MILLERSHRNTEHHGVPGDATIIRAVVRK